MTTYLFGIAEGKFGVQETYEFIKTYWPDRFPKLPSYKDYNRRIDVLLRREIACILARGRGAAVNTDAPLPGILKTGQITLRFVQQKGYPNA